MQHQQEIGGAQALLQLGTKTKQEEEDTFKKHEGDDEENSDLNVDNSSNDHDDVHLYAHHELDEHGLTNFDDEHQNETENGQDEKATNQQINDAVEAAVMRYVGGTLDDNSRKNGSNLKRRHQDDIMSNINEYQWDRFLEDEVSQSNNQSNNNDIFDSYDLSNRSTPKRKKKKMESDIDPELSGLHTNSEHDQLVQAAIMGAGELAKQLGSDDNNLHNAQQVIAAATAAVQNQNGSPNQESVAAINQLAQAASSLSNNNYSKLSQQPLKRTQRRSLKKNDVKNKPYQDENIKFTEHTSIESLIQESSVQACNWYNTVTGLGHETNGPRPFSQEEISAVDHFVDGYCHINKLTREDVCNRVWANEKTKDSFWESLTRVLPYRSRASVYKHVKRQYHIFTVRAKWDQHDDEVLRNLASTKAGNWKEIGELMGRMPEDCRDRWRNYVKCGENRASNKWSEDEENKLREIVLDMVSDLKNKAKNTINWTLVSERMNGRRSRIQCRYKWNKLLKREAISRCNFMNLDTKLWLLHKLQQLNYSELSTVNWNYVLEQFTDYIKTNPEDAKRFVNPDFFWTPTDFMIAFDRLKSSIKDHKNLNLPTLLDFLINKLYGSSMNMIEQKKKESLPEDDAATIANAAVAAVSPESQAQEYLWR